MPIVYRGRVFSVETGKRRFPNGQEHDVEIVRHAPSVVLIPIEDDGRVVIVRQYRAPLDRELWEFPAGRLNDGESPEEAARRECEEEIGYVPRRLERLRSLFPAPGFCDEELIFFRVSDLRTPPADSPHQADEDEDITCRSVPMATLKRVSSRNALAGL